MDQFYINFNDIREQTDRRFVGLLICCVFSVGFIISLTFLWQSKEFSLLWVLTILFQCIIIFLYGMEWKGVAINRLLGKAFLQVHERGIEQRVCGSLKKNFLSWSDVALIRKDEKQIVLLSHTDEILRIKLKHLQPADRFELSATLCFLSRRYNISVDDVACNH